MADEPLHEIQLNGKQLVFLFMSATVVAVVVFLLGVMVGRGVQVPQPGTTQAFADEAIDPTASAPAPAATPTTPDSGPATAQETLTYATRLEGTAPAEENLREPGAEPTPAREPVAAAPPPPPAPAPVPVPAPAAAPKPVVTPPAQAAARPATTPTPAAAAVRPEPAGSGFVVQVAATRQRSEADSIARRLAGKGYPAFVTSPAGGPNMFRVRVGKYTDRREAETIASRLEREEQFKPWITR